MPKPYSIKEFLIDRGIDPEEFNKKHMKKKIFTEELHLKNYECLNNESKFKFIKYWFCRNILRHCFIKHAWIYNGFYIQKCRICKTIISEPLKEIK